MSRSASDSDHEKTVSEDRRSKHRPRREGTREKHERRRRDHPLERERDRKRRSRSRSRSRSPGRFKRKDRKHHRGRSRSRSRSKEHRRRHHHRSKSRSRTPDKRRGKEKCRSKSPEKEDAVPKPPSHNEETPKPTVTPLMSFSIPPPMLVTPTSLGQQSEDIGAQVFAAAARLRQQLQENASQAQPATSVGAFSVPAAAKLAEQQKKRAMLWKGKKTETADNSKESLWAATNFDADGKATEKFRKLMGIKNASAAEPSSGTNIQEEQQKLFQSLDRQYEVARMSTHTHRGVGLGFSGAPSGFQTPLNNPKAVVMYRFVFGVTLFSLVLGVFSIGSFPPDGEPGEDQCEPISIELCMDLHYNLTRMPNILNHQKQKDAGEELFNFSPLIKVKCSEDLRLFLCSVYAPVCTILEKPLPPCRSLCESARDGCLSVLERFGYEWPKTLDCSRFPAFGELCFGKEVDGNGPVERRPVHEDAFPRVNEIPERNLGFICPVQFQTPEQYGEYTLQVGDAVEKRCGAPCDGMFFSKEHRRFAALWIFGWSVCCLISCSFTVATFFIEMSRFKYPERPIIFLSICYLMVALSYVFGYAFGDEVACNQPFPPPRGREDLAGDMARLIVQGTKKESCTILFMLLYFFTMASYVWWCVLALTWFLSAGLKWGNEAIESHSHYFHLAAWAIPSVKTIVILAMTKVEGDVLSGVCFVGLWNVTALRGFVVAPLVAYLLIGTGFLIAGLVSLFRIRTIMKRDGASTQKLEKLMWRIGVFSMLFVVPASVVVGCLLYEQANFESWMLAWQRDICELREFAIPCPKDGDYPKANFAVFMLKYPMALIVGITSGFWTWSSKTLSSWTQFYHRLTGLCCRRDSRQQDVRRGKFRGPNGMEEESLHLDMKYTGGMGRHDGFL